MANETTKTIDDVCEEEKEPIDVLVKRFPKELWSGTAPFLYGNTVYVVADDGKVYDLQTQERAPADATKQAYLLYNRGYLKRPITPTNNDCEVI